MDLNSKTTYLILNAVKFYLNELNLQSSRMIREDMLFPDSVPMEKKISIITEIDMYKKLKDDLTIRYDKYLDLNE